MYFKKRHRSEVAYVRQKEVILCWASINIDVVSYSYENLLINISKKGFNHCHLNT